MTNRQLGRRAVRFALVAAAVLAMAWAAVGPPSFAAQPKVDAQLEIVSITDDPETVTPGGELTYEIVATNLGPSGVFEGRVTIQPPSQLASVQVVEATSITAGLDPVDVLSSCSQATLTCDVGLMAAPPAIAGQPGPTTVEIVLAAQVRPAAELDLPDVMTLVVAIDATDDGIRIEGDQEDENTTIAAPPAPPPRGSMRVTVDADRDGSFGVQEGPVPSGSIARFRADVANTGGSALTLTALQDSLGGLTGLGGCLSPPPAVIDPGATARCEFDATVSGPPGSVVTNQVTATAEDGTEFSDTAFVTIATAAAPPRIRVTATPDPAVIQAPGATVRYEVAVVNEQAEPAEIVSLTDTRGGSLAGRGDCRTGVTIVPNGTYQCAYSEFVSGAAGTTALNMVTAVAQDEAGATATDTDSADVLVAGGPDPQPGQIAVSVAGADPVEGTDGVQWTVTVANNGQGSVTLETLRTDRASTIPDCPTGATVDQTPYTCAFSSRVPTGNAGDRESITVTASTAGGATASGSATVVFRDAQPSLSVTATSPGSVIAGEELPVTLVVTNTSSAATDPLDVVSIGVGGADRSAGCSIPRLARGAASRPCTLSVPVDGAPGTPVVAEVVVRAADDEGTPATATARTESVVASPDDFRLDMVLIDAELDSLDEPPDIVAADTRFRYVVVVVNRADQAAALPEVLVDLPDEVREPGLECGADRSLTVGEVPPRERRIASVTVEPCPGGAATAVASASVPGLPGVADDETTRVFGGDPARAGGTTTTQPPADSTTTTIAPDPEVLVAGTVFLDADGDLQRDAVERVAGEEGLEGVIVELEAGGEVLQAPTGADGRYAFPDPVAGPGQVRVVADSVPRGLEATTPTEYEVESGGPFDFGFWREGSTPPGEPGRPSNAVAWGGVALGLGAVGAAEALFGLHATGRLPRRRP